MWLAGELVSVRCELVVSSDLAGTVIHRVCGVYMKTGMKLARSCEAAGYIRGFQYQHALAAPGQVGCAD